MKIYTKTGDKGQTSLFDEKRVSKDDIRVESYGTVDELGAALGVARNYLDDKDMFDEIIEIQNKLFVVAENLATSDPENVKHHITDADIKLLEDLVDKYMEKAGPFKGFIINGTSKAAAYLHFARTICRRAERRIISLSGEEKVDPLVKQYVNRLADTIYAFARACEEEDIYVNFEGNIK